jgi:hypothetical protein
MNLNQSDTVKSQELDYNTYFQFKNAGILNILKSSLHNMPKILYKQITRN